jgi:hypothetical protein
VQTTLAADKSLAGKQFLTGEPKLNIGKSPSCLVGTEKLTVSKRKGNLNNIKNIIGL